MIDFFVNNFWILMFYGFIIFLIYWNRAKFEFPAKFIAMYKTSLGIKLMDKIASKYRECVKIFGYIGVGVGFLGMIVIISMLLYSLLGLIFSPQSSQGVSLVIPGIKMANSVYIPFLQGILAIFVIATMHEMAHGIVARAWRIPVLSSGIVFFGPIIGAFVEPDDKKMSRTLDIEQYSVFAAGPFINILFTVLLFALLFFTAPLITSSIYDGAQIMEIQDGSPAQLYGLGIENTITEINYVEINTVSDLNKQLANVKINDNIKVKLKDVNNNIIEKDIIVGEKNNNPYLGIMVANLEKYQTGFGYYYSYVIKWLLEFFSWLINLSLAIGLINLLPLGPTDGGRMIHLATKSIFKDKGDKIFANISFVSLMILLANLLLSYAKPFIM